MTEDKKYPYISIMHYDEAIEEENVADFALTEKYLKHVCSPSEGELWPDSNQYIGKPRWTEVSLSRIQKMVTCKEQIDFFCEQYPENYGQTFTIWNDDYNASSDENVEMVIKYTPQR
jgi:hypothetical protein